MLLRTPASKSEAARTLAGLAVAALCAGPSLAGRPLAVDDANVNAVGAAHVEVWYERLADNTHVGTVAPALGVAEGVEISAAFARDAGNDVSTTLLQAKFRWTPSLDTGCNIGSSIGASQTHNSSAHTVFVNGLLTCNADFGSLHLNLGSTRAPEGPALGTWGVALEHGFGAWTAHVETFGQEQTSPTVQLGLRTDIAKNLQWDATVGRVNNETVLSLGMKFQF
ncbi:MAG: hypothetical protein V4858_20615 [Pseudomonadota bacterium]